MTTTAGAGLYDGDSALHPAKGGVMYKGSPLLQLPQSSSFGATKTPAPSGLSIHHWSSAAFKYM
eukprot:CAMPEP_0197182658 /NCGR_PEP_ID=MMETSP1423-20130617/6543_1 /TAXON_ID=476441 /ORGANISM="Pseudo-nitzschia heimii, Strain UNC1101" /LENGTH=63 /DNA_ID=CAMNT_0042633111 /DNA_START=80 /DNA_END=271 /DNA_ORIENTATION=+